MSEKKIGLLGGTFDPIHWGHLNLAFELMERRQLDRVWFIPAQSNPLKTAASLASMNQRLAMVQLAIEGIPQFEWKDLEARRPGPSYTIDTLRSLTADQSLHATPNQFYLLLGEDAVSGFLRWRSPEEIITLAPLLIGSRSCALEPEWDDCSPSIRTAIKQGMTSTRLMDISATDIRERLACNLYCGHLVPPSVLKYIHNNELYS